MTRFLDGPAKGTTLQLRRSPFFIRAVKAPGGKWDALDQLDDTPATAEEITVYRREAEPVMVHCDGRTPGGKRTSWTASCADYRVAVTQPPDAIARRNTAWQAWCQRTALHE